MGEGKRLTVKTVSEEPAVSNPVKIRMYYDRAWRTWAVYPVDVNGYQTDDAIYVYSKAEAESIKRDLEQRLGITT